MPIRNLRARGGGGVTSPNQSTSSSSPNRITRGPVMARGDDNENGGGGGWEDDSIASNSKYKDRSGGEVELSLYEKLQQQHEIELQQQQQQQQSTHINSNSRERGPLLDSDHTTRKTHTTTNTSDNNSIASGWSWETRSSLNVSRVQTKYANKKDMVYNAFGNENVIKERIMNVMNCTKNGRGGYNTVSQQRYNNNRNDGEDSDDDGYYEKNQQHQSTSTLNKIAKLCLFLLLLFMGIRTINRKRNKNNQQQGEVVDDSLFAMSEQYLRGQLDGVLGSETNTNSINGGEYTTSNVIVHDAIFPKHLSHLTNLTTMYNPQIETPYFWDVHFSGESIAEHVFSSCHELVLACEFGLRQPDYNEDVSFVYVCYISFVLCCV